MANKSINIKYPFKDSPKGFFLDLNTTDTEAIKSDLLQDLHVELTVIDSKIYPYAQDNIILYPDIWNSAVTSGQVRLLDNEQLIKLTSVYSIIRNLKYETELIKSNEDAFNILAG